MRAVWLLVLLALACLPRTASASLDAQTKQPYRLRVVLHVEEHRFLTPVFRAQLERELGDLLRHSFGELVKVEVEHWDAVRHPILKEIERRGLQQALEGWEDTSPGKTHFLLLRFAADRYELRSRQHDGMTGLCTGAERRAEVTDPRLVAREAARLVERDFGVVGTVVSVGERGVEVAIKGGALGVPLRRWIQPGDVLSVVSITREKERERGTRVEWVLLRVDAELGNGVYRCRLFNRFPQDNLAEEPGVLGYRCLRVSAVRAPLRLRLVDDKTGQPLAGVRVRVRRSGFTQGKANELATGPNGMAETEEVYERAAFVQVVDGAAPARLPVLLLDERPVVCPLGAGAGDQAEQGALLKLRRDRWVRGILDGLRVAAQRVHELNAERGKSLENTLAMARDGYGALKADLDNLTAEHKELQAADGKLDLHEGEQQLAALKKQGEVLRVYIDGLDKVIKEAKGEKAQRRRALYEKARLLETQAEYQEALDLYDEILKENPNETNVKADRDRLARAWQTKGPAHEKARQFIYETWPKLDLAGVQAEVKRARAELAVLKKAGDRLTPRKMLQANVEHGTRLKKRLEVLKRLDSEDNRAEAVRLLRLADDLQGLHQELTAYLGKE